jgi:transcriptional regulator with XRE-family HTH domain
MRMTTNQPLPWKVLREIAGLSQREVGRRANINSGRLSIIERGVTPTDEEAARLRAVLVGAIDEPKEVA